MPGNAFLRGRRGGEAQIEIPFFGGEFAQGAHGYRIFYLVFRMSLRVNPLNYTCARSAFWPGRRMNQAVTHYASPAMLFCPEIGITIIADLSMSIVSSMK